MCLGEMPIGGYTPMPAPNYCPLHPKFDMGRGRWSGFGGYIFDRRCEHCIVETIRNIPKWYGEFLKEETQPDLNTIQIVLDVLDQKLGIR